MADVRSLTDTMMKRTLVGRIRSLLCLSGALFALTACDVSGTAHAQDYPFTLAKSDPRAMRAWGRVVPKRFAGQAWIRSLAGTASPLESATIAGQPYYYGAVCKPHFCGGNVVAFLISRDGAQAYGVLSSEELRVPRAVFGAPTPEALTLLARKLAP